MHLAPRSGRVRRENMGMIATPRPGVVCRGERRLPATGAETLYMYKPPISYHWLNSP